MPADFIDFHELLLLLLLPFKAQKTNLAPVTDHIKAISCFGCVILALMGVVVHVCMCVHTCLHVHGTQVVLSSEVPEERWGPRKAVGKESKMPLSHTSMQRQQMCQTTLCSHLCAHTFVHKSS